MRRQGIIVGRPSSHLPGEDPVYAMKNERALKYIRKALIPTIAGENLASTSQHETAGNYFQKALM
jgi:imidazolonepropionase-like amidohydrolase